MATFISAPSGLLARPPARLGRRARLGSGAAPCRAPAVATARPPPAATPGGVSASGAAPTTVATLAGAATGNESGVARAAEQWRGGLPRRAFLAAAAAAAASAVAAGGAAPRSAAAAAAAAAATATPTFFDLTASRGGAPAPLRDLFDGKVTLVVNVASYCALTPQYEGLVALHRKYAAGGEGKRPFDIAAFPCNQVRLWVGG